MAKMRALILTESYLPHLGGVEKHIAAIIPHLETANIKIELISKRRLLGNAKKIKFLTLFKIWWELAKKIKIIKDAEIVLIHDVFIYYLPFALIFPKKKIVTTFHGHEKIYPIPFKNIFYKKIAQFFSHSTISIGAYINEHYHLKSKNNYISYGGVEISKNAETKKQKNSFVFLGRLEKDTGLAIFLEFLDILKEKKVIFSVTFCGDGPMREKCERYGKVLGFIKDTRHYLAVSEHCFAGGYLSILEAMSEQTFVLTAYDTPLKKDYLLKSPFAKTIAVGNTALALYQSYSKMKKDTSILEKNYAIAKERSFENLGKLYLHCIWSAIKKA